MSDNTNAVADHASETYPVYSAKIQDGYIEGYDVVSYEAPHSSLLKTITWVGMGLIMGILPAIGTLTFGAAAKIYPFGTSAQYADTLIIVGAILTVVIAIAAIVMVKVGRKGYRAYHKETGRYN